MTNLYILFNRCPIFIFLKSFKTFVQIGRVAFVAYGADEGKLVAIVDIIDVNKVSQQQLIAVTVVI